MEIDELKPGVTITGPRWPEPVNVKIAKPQGSYIQLIGVGTSTNQHIDQLIPRGDFASMSIMMIPSDFSGDASKVFLALESKRYRLASLYDPLLAMSTSKIELLPHQIEAVYEYILPKSKIRFLLAHDPGAGKTIMAGLVIKELKLRRVIKRVLIVVPGHLKDQWRMELKDKFEEKFTVVTRSYIGAHHGENVWRKENQIITSIDFAKRDEIIPGLADSEFDLIIVDEAHKMSATRYSEKTDRTNRYKLGQLLSKNSEHLLFLTATPHRGDQDNFRLFLDLLSPGFFISKSMINESIEKGDNPLFLRKSKEDMVDFNGDPLFVQRTVKMLKVDLSEAEAKLYNQMSIYVREQYNKALKSDKKRNISFALVILQRRMASSTYALYQSLERRKNKLEKMLKDTDKPKPENLGNARFDFEVVEDMSEEERWREEEIWETLSVAENRQELKSEIATLYSLMSMAENIIENEEEAKLSELKNALEKLGSSDEPEKLLIFTESKSTLTYIEGKVRGWGYKVNTIHGGMHIDDRRDAETIFRNETQIMVATEAAGEGINLQFCHLMINYDLPWNPNRLEQRMGRIHRYGQKDDVTVVNMVADKTREGRVMLKLFDKLNEIKTAMGRDKVFDVITDVFPGISLSQMMVDAAANTRDQEEIIKELNITVNKELIAKLEEKMGDSLATKYMNYMSIKKMRDKALGNKLIPEYVKMMFTKAFEIAGGRIRHHPDGHSSIEFIPYDISKISNENEFKKSFGTILKSYKKATFDKDASLKNPNLEFITFGHPLFESVLEWIDRSFEDDLQKGAVFLDPVGTDGYVLFHEGEIVDGINNIAGKKLFSHFVDIKSGNATPVPPSWLWDLKESDSSDPETDINKDRLRDNILAQVINDLDNYLIELKDKRECQAEIKRKYGVESIRQSITDLDNQLIGLEARKYEGENVQLVIRNKSEKKREYEERKVELEEFIEKETTLTIKTPKLLCLIRVKPLIITGGPDMSRDPDVEKAGMRLAMQYERENGREPVDVSKENTGYDVYSKDSDDRVRFIEVKARAGEGEIVLTPNEWLSSMQLGDKYYLYVVWNAIKNPSGKPLIIKNPAKNLSVEKKIVRYFVNPKEIRDKSQ